MSMFIILSVIKNQDDNGKKPKTKKVNATQQSYLCWLLQRKQLMDFLFVGTKSTAVGSEK